MKLKCIQTTDGKFEGMTFDIGEQEMTRELAMQISHKQFDDMKFENGHIRFVGSNYTALLKIIK